MQMALNQFAVIVSRGATSRGADLDWSQVGPAETALARATWIRRHAPEGARVRLQAVKGALRAAWRLGLIDTDRFQRAIDLAPIPGKSLPTGRALDSVELDALFRACADDGSAFGRRDAALFAAFRSGARIGEVRALDIEDFGSPGPDGLATLRIFGKGNRERLNYLPAALAALISLWVVVRGPAPGPLFQPLSKGGRSVLSRRLSERAIQEICTARAVDAGVRRFTSHDFRRTTATELDDAGEAITVIRDVLGHQSVQTTELYLRNDREERKRRAAGRLRVPGGRGDG